MVTVLSLSEKRGKVIFYNHCVTEIGQIKDICERSQTGNTKTYLLYIFPAFRVELS